MSEPAQHPRRDHRSPLDDAATGDDVRWEKVMAARRKLALGVYDTDAAIDIIIERLLADLA